MTPNLEWIVVYSYDSITGIDLFVYICLVVSYIQMVLQLSSFLILSCLLPKNKCFLEIETSKLNADPPQILKTLTVTQYFTYISQANVTSLTTISWFFISQKRPSNDSYDNFRSICHCLWEVINNIICPQKSFTIDEPLPFVGHTVWHKAKKLRPSTIYIVCHFKKWSRSLDCIKLPLDVSVNTFTYICALFLPQPASIKGGSDLKE